MWNQAKTGILVDRGKGILAFVEKGPEFDALKRNAQDWHEAEHSFAPSPVLTEDQVRGKRDRLLSASDWTQVADAPVDQAAWAEYRQALRDVPSQDGFPHSVVWPVSPSR